MNPWIILGWFVLALIGLVIALLIVFWYGYILKMIWEEIESNLDGVIRGIYIFYLLLWLSPLVAGIIYLMQRLKI